MRVIWVNTTQAIVMRESTWNIRSSAKDLEQAVAEIVSLENDPCYRQIFEAIEENNG